MSTSTDSPLAASLAADPFHAVAVHYGMLLGVSDFQVISANPRGKLRLHQAWQHGPGVVWGFGVSVVKDTAELQVGAGLAVDGLGRETALGTPCCIDVAEWLDAQVKAGTVVPKVNGDTTTFNAQVILRYRACLTNPVPSMSTTCDGGGGEFAYSRILETAELELRPYPDDADGRPHPPPDDRDTTFAKLRALVRDGTIDTVVTEPPTTGWLDAFRTVAAREVTALAPPGFGGAPTSSRLFPEDEPGELVLADLPGLQLHATAGGPRLTAPAIDIGIRRSHVPTWVIEELIAEVLSGQAGGAPALDAGGPRVSGITVTGTTATVELTGEVIASTVADGFELRSITTSDVAPAWSAPLGANPQAHAPQAGTPPVPATITFDLPDPLPDATTFRLVLRGTGPTPIVGLAGGRPIPLAGRVGGPVGTAVEGHDVVEIFEGALP